MTVSNLSKIRRNIRKLRCTSGINDTDGKFATGVNHTGGENAAGINDTGSKWPLVSTTLAANFATSFASVVDIGGKFAAGVNDTGGNLPLVSMTPVAICHWYQ